MIDAHVMCGMLAHELVGIFGTQANGLAYTVIHQEAIDSELDVNGGESLWTMRCTLT